MTDSAPRRSVEPVRRAPGPLTLRHVPLDLDEEPAFRDDPLMEWSHEPEPPPTPRVARRSWPPAPADHP